MPGVELEYIASVLTPNRQAGVCLHFSSLPSPYGIGDIGDAAQAFLQQLGAMGMAAWQFLPTGPTAYGDSPYQPLSAFAGNEMLIGLEPLLRAGFLHEEELQVLTRLDQASVDFGQLIPAKQQLLALAAERFESRANSAMKTDFDAFMEQHSERWLKNYALYRILKTRHGEKPWPEWNTEFVQRDPAALTRVCVECHDQLQHLAIVQFFFYQQWRALREAARARNIKLFGDMPIYIALDSADAWANPELLKISCSGQPTHVAGVPPDYFSADGQLWGNPLYDWAAHARTGYAWWIDRMRHASEQNDLVRVDHFRGFESFWAVPFGAITARNGVWQRGPRDGLFLAMQTALGHLPIVAENLGVITPEVEALRLRHQMPGMVVLQFKVNNPEFDGNNMAANNVCYTGTHDNDTTVGWFRGGQENQTRNDTRAESEIKTTQQNVLRLTKGSAATIHTDLIRLAFNTPARLVVVPLQDYLGLGSDGRMNVPGTTMNNWRWRLQPGDLSQKIIRQIQTLVTESGRNCRQQ
ncbi:MAG: 4-alpha-glucanotransferase [Xanthomonadales bacterium]|nr:4-alpha-glucanotransferase [Xanthomonadales bacterium]